VPVEQVTRRRGERTLTYVGIAMFAVLGVLAVALWLREGQLVYIEQVLSGLANCL
jgi:hypothetical protein